MIIYIKDFSEYPGLRHCSISDDSGEEFYHSILNSKFKEAYETKQELIINIDNTAGYAPSFLDEAFGNLVFDFGLKTAKKYLRIVSVEEPDLKELIFEQTFKQWEIRRKNNETPKKTINHEDWYRLENNSLKLINN